MKLKNLFDAGAAIVLGLGLGASVQAAGDPAKGQALYATCASCHGANGEGNQALNAPAIAGQQDWYLTRQLKNYQEGIRGTHAKDVYGMQMRPMSMVVMGDDRCVMLRNCLEVLVADGRWQVQLLSFGGDVGLLVRGAERCVCSVM